MASRGLPAAPAPPHEPVTIEFFRRFLQHALPTGFQRIRHFGFLANRVRAEKLALCRKLLGDINEPNGADVGPEPASDTREPDDLCPQCKVGRIRYVEAVEPGSALNVQETLPLVFDTS